MHFGLSPLQSGGDFEATIAECERAEAAGFDSVWLGEHHNSILLYPAPLVGLAAIAARTRRVRLGTGVLLLPLYHPLAVAEEAAMVDVISRGRLILGVGAGYAPEEFAAFGISTKERGSRATYSTLRYLLRRLAKASAMNMYSVDSTRPPTRTAGLLALRRRLRNRLLHNSRWRGRSRQLAVNTRPSRCRGRLLREHPP